MVPTNMQQMKNVKHHDLSNTFDSEDGKEENNKGSNPLGLSETQLPTVSLFVKSAVAAAMAQVLPLRGDNNQNASGQASPGTSAQQQHFGISDKILTNTNDNGCQEEGEVKDEELDEYEKELQNLLGDVKATGLEISEKISRLLERSLGNPLNEKLVKLKWDAYPRPDNGSNLKVSRANLLIFSKSSSEHQGLDQALQVTRSYLVGGITAVGCQAEKQLDLRSWASGLEQEDKDNLPDQIQHLTESM